MTKLAMLEWLLKLVTTREGHSNEEDIKVDCAKMWLLLLIGKEKALSQ